MVADLSHIKKAACLIICLYCIYFLEFNDISVFSEDTLKITIKFKNLSLPSKYLITPNLDKCRGPKAPTVVSMVISAAANHVQRATIRSTWANPKYSKAVQDGRVLVYFIVSRPKSKKLLEIIEQEVKKHNDIVMVDLEESYENLVLKVYSTFLFVNKFCSSASYTMKIDDDVVVHLDRLFHFLVDTTSSRDALLCKVWDSSVPVRKPGSKWFLPKSEYPAAKFPKYCNGPMYLIGATAAKKILQKSQTMEYFKLEDVFFTGLAAKSAKLTHIYWGKHMRARNDELWWGEDECDKRKEPLLFSVHSLNTTEQFRKGHEVIQKLKCASKEKIDERRRIAEEKKKKESKKH